MKRVKFFLRKFKYNHKRTFLFGLFFLLFIGVSVGYAFLTTTLNITGALNVASSKWDIHFENVEVQEGSVEATTPPTITDNTSISFSTILNNPGDFYEFTVDVVNDGTYDAKIDTITITPTLTNEQKEYFDYIVEYTEGGEIKVGDALDAGTSESIKVTYKYKKNDDDSKYPEEDTTFNLTVTMNYVQGKGNEVHHTSLYSVLKDAAVEGTYAKEYTGEHHDSFTKEPSKKIYHWYGSNNDNGTAILDKNNVIFANHCWQMIRTTDTGGVKMIYNGVPNSGQCNNEGEAQQIGNSTFNSNAYSLAYVGYMYNPNTLVSYGGSSAATSGSLFGKGVTYSNGSYTLTDTSTTYDDNHHYTCNNTSGTCSSIRYYHYKNYYINIDDGRTIEECLEDMLSADDVNQTNSIIKTAIDTWYQSHMTEYTEKLEDTIFCNDRSITNLGGWNPNGGSTTMRLQFKNYGSNLSLSCSNTTDQFSVRNSKAPLLYPIGLISRPEMSLLDNNNVRKTGKDYNLISPTSYDSSAYRGVLSYGGHMTGSEVDNTYGVRPAISLNPGTKYSDGDGSMANPYVVE